jgi:alanine dehydrogenase
MELTQTLLLSRNDVSKLLTLEECMSAVENAFKLHSEGKTHTPKVLGLPAQNGGFHIKAGMLGSNRKYFAAKVNANFPGNNNGYGLPTIQGIIILFDAINGRVLALMDSIEITIIRTGAATAIAAKYLAPLNSKVATICGCGNQGKISLKAIMKVRPLETIYAYDIDKLQSEKLVNEFKGKLDIISLTIKDLHTALRKSEICVTCTPSKKPFVHAEDIMPGAFIAAVGADSEDKQELFSDFLASNKIVVDVAEQCAEIGELHHAIQHGLITVTGVHAELGDIICGKTQGRETDQEIIIFDSTGTALQDVACAAIVYDKAIASGIGKNFNFSDI